LQGTPKALSIPTEFDQRQEDSIQFSAVVQLKDLLADMMIGQDEVIASSSDCNKNQEILEETLEVFA
jgi:hypothetical protein